MAQLCAHAYCTEEAARQINAVFTVVTRTQEAEVFYGHVLQRDWHGRSGLLCTGMVRITIAQLAGIGLDSLRFLIEPGQLGAHADYQSLTLEEAL